MLLRGSGNATHEGHPPQIPEELLNRKRNVGEEDLGNINAMAVANITSAQTALAQTVLVQKAKTGERFTCSQIACMQCSSRMAKDLMDSDGIEGGSSSDNMLDHLEKSGASYYGCIYHHKTARSSETHERRRPKLVIVMRRMVKAMKETVLLNLLVL
jgi:hypothetical protein